MAWSRASPRLSLAILPSERRDAKCRRIQLQRKTDRLCIYVRIAIRRHGLLVCHAAYGGQRLCPATFTKSGNGIREPRCFRIEVALRYCGDRSHIAAFHTLSRHGSQIRKERGEISVAYQWVMPRRARIAKVFKKDFRCCSVFCVACEIKSAPESFTALPRLHNAHDCGVCQRWAFRVVKYVVEFRLPEKRG